VGEERAGEDVVKKRAAMPLYRIRDLRADEKLPGLWGMTVTLELYSIGSFKHELKRLEMAWRSFTPISCVIGSKGKGEKKAKPAPKRARKRKGQKAEESTS
jgi:hypothetical protein